MNIEQLTPREHEIVKELSRAFDRLGAERGIFAALHSWGDTQPEDDVLKLLREQNDMMEAQNAISTSTSSTQVCA